MKNRDLHNSSFNRVWLKTIITVKFALKNHGDSISQSSKSSILDLFVNIFMFDLSFIEFTGFLDFLDPKNWVFSHIWHDNSIPTSLR